MENWSCEPTFGSKEKFSKDTFLSARKSIFHFRFRVPKAALGEIESENVCEVGKNVRARVRRIKLARD